VLIHIQIERTQPLAGPAAAKEAEPVPFDGWLAGSGHRQRGIPDEEDIMLLEHAHQPGRFDPGHCRDCARETDLLDHYWRVQREEQAFNEARRDLAGSRW
jgi:hypothetical protein